MAGAFEAALEDAQTWSTEHEITREELHLKESLQARSHLALGNLDRAQDLARQALERLELMAAEWPNDNGVEMARQIPLAIIGDLAGLKAANEAAQQARILDVIVNEADLLTTAAAFAIIGETETAINLLEEMLEFPYINNIHYVVSLPEFKAIKNDQRIQGWLAEHQARVQADREQYARQVKQ